MVNHEIDETTLGCVTGIKFGILFSTEVVVYTGLCAENYCSIPRCRTHIDAAAMPYIQYSTEGIQSWKDD